MRTPYFSAVLIALSILFSCTSTNSDTMYDPNAPVAAINISKIGVVDASSRTIALPAGEDELLTAFRNAFSNDGWTTSTSTTATRYVMQLETKVWDNNQRLSYIHMAIVDERNGKTILTGERKTYSPSDPPIDITAVATMVVSSLRDITSGSDTGSKPQ